MRLNMRLPGTYKFTLKCVIGFGSLLLLLLIIWKLVPVRIDFGPPAQIPIHLELNATFTKHSFNVPECQVFITESIPENLTYPPASPKHDSTFSAWSSLLDAATENVNIASFYWSLLAEDKFNFSATKQGHDIFQMLLTKGRSVSLSIAQSGKRMPDSELDTLVKQTGASVYWVDVAKLMGAGVLHTKLWTVDGRHAYVGSANMDWRSLTEVKELGATFINCAELVSDLDKIHSAYRIVSGGIPTTWPKSLETRYNHRRPMEVNINGVASRVYFSSSPSKFNPPGRNNDLDALLSVITEAKQFIYISVMDYSPEIVNYTRPITAKFWPIIDDALRRAALDRGVEVRLLISRWPYTSPAMAKYLNSLRTVNDIHGSKIRIRYFIVPAFNGDQRRIPHSRVNHNKYMVTDKASYIGTSNWSGDYFIYTGGIAFVSQDVEMQPGDNSSTPEGKGPKTIRKQLTDIFLRDWNSEYSTEL